MHRTSNAVRQMSERDFDALKACVHEDFTLALRLRRSKPGALVPELLALAEERGLEVTADELESAIANGRREWIMRWTR